MNPDVVDLKSGPGLGIEGAVSDRLGHLGQQQISWSRA